MGVAISGNGRWGSALPRGAAGGCKFPWTTLQGRICHPPSEVLVLTPLPSPQCAGEENWVDNRTIYVGHKEPPPGADAYIPQRYPDNRIVSAKVTSLSLLTSFGEHWDFLTAVSYSITAFTATFHS